MKANIGGIHLKRECVSLRVVWLDHCGKNRDEKHVEGAICGAHSRLQCKSCMRVPRLIETRSARPRNLKETHVDMLNLPALYRAARRYPITAEPTTEPNNPDTRYTKRTISAKTALVRCGLTLGGVRREGVRGRALCCCASSPDSGSWTAVVGDVTSVSGMVSTSWSEWGGE